MITIKKHAGEYELLPTEPCSFRAEISKQYIANEWQIDIYRKDECVESTRMPSKRDCVAFFSNFIINKLSPSWDK